MSGPMILENKKRIHFTGIGGAGMSGLADILIDMGYQVSGSDREKSETTAYLESRGATIFEGHQPGNITDAELLVYSSAVPADNPELAAASDKGLSCIKRARLLGELMMQKEGIAVAGTHGKTTTTSMTGHILSFCGLDPTVVVGGKMQNSRTNARLGKGDFFVAEADEYDRSFLTLFPRIAVLNNLEADHLDIYRNLDDLKDTFLQFAGQTKKEGRIIFNADSENIADLMVKYQGARSSFGLEKEADFKADNISFKDGRTQFDVVFGGNNRGAVQLKLPGRHNIYNALASVAVGMEIGLRFDQVQQALLAFKGVQRRFEFKDSISNVLFFDDYAHHPTEVEQAIEAARSGWQKRVIVVFQPHLYSRTGDFYKDFAKALSHADKVILTPIYPAREKPRAGITSDLIAREMDENCISLKSNSMIEEAILKTIRADDLVLTMGAGDIWKYGERSIEKLRLLNSC